jgi:hypothetical protein
VAIVLWDDFSCEVGWLYPVLAFVFYIMLGRYQGQLREYPVGFFKRKLDDHIVVAAVDWLFPHFSIF